MKNSMMKNKAQMDLSSGIVKVVEGIVEIIGNIQRAGASAPAPVLYFIK